MDDPILEADYFVDTVTNAGGFEGNLSPVLDFETNRGGWIKMNFQNGLRYGWNV